MRRLVTLTIALAASGAPGSVTTLQDLAPKIAPAASATAAAAEFSWTSGEPKPVAGSLGAVYAMLDQERTALEAEQRATASQVMAGGSTRPTGTAGGDRAALARIAELTRSMMMARAQGMMPFNQAIADFNALKAAREASHRQIDLRQAAELQTVPYARVQPLGGCYSPANAGRARAIQLKYAGEHIATADRDLHDAAARADTVRALLLPVAREDDALMTAYAEARPLFAQDMHIRAQYGGNALGLHAVTLGMYFGQFADAVRDTDLAAAQRVRAKSVLEGAPPDVCR